MRRLSLSEIQLVIADKGGTCLSTSYLNCTEKLMWCCAEGHTWEALATNVIHLNRWCPYCSGRIKTAEEANRLLDQIINIVVAKGGHVLSQVYSQKIELVCSHGHIWKASPSNIRQGTWCRFCAGTTPHEIRTMHKLAAERGGLCLSDKYVTARAKLRWQCAQGHRWEATATNLISRKSWCPTCAGCARLSLVDMQAVASARGGVCLSLTYLNNRAKLSWRCAYGHTWESKAAHILQGSWCPYCLEHTGEKSCRDWLETHFGVLFPKVWPSWLRRSDTGRSLQLDGYNDQLKLAFEYQGAQHYRFSPPFHRTVEDFESQVVRDREKSFVCANQGVTLIVVPFTKLRSIPTFLEQAVCEFQMREVG